MLKLEYKMETEPQPAEQPDGRVVINAVHRFLAPKVTEVVRHGHYSDQSELPNNVIPFPVPEDVPPQVA